MEDVSRDVPIKEVQRDYAIATQGTREAKLITKSALVSVNFPH